MCILYCGILWHKQDEADMLGGYVFLCNHLYDTYITPSKLYPKLLVHSANWRRIALTLLPFCLLMPGSLNMSTPDGQQARPRAHQAAAKWENL